MTCHQVYLGEVDRRRALLTTAPHEAVQHLEGYRLSVSAGEELFAEHPAQLRRHRRLPSAPHPVGYQGVEVILLRLEAGRRVSVRALALLHV